jgi:hypothetical protein
MKTKFTNLAVSLLLGVLAAQLTHAEAKPLSSFSSTELAERTIQRRAVEAVVWGMPLVNTDAMRQAYFRDVGAKYNDICYFSKPRTGNSRSRRPMLRRTTSISISI